MRNILQKMTLCTRLYIFETNVLAMLSYYHQASEFCFFIFFESPAHEVLNITAFAM